DSSPRSRGAEISGLTQPRSLRTLPAALRAEPSSPSLDEAGVPGPTEDDDDDLPHRAATRARTRRPRVARARTGRRRGADQGASLAKATPAKRHRSDPSGIESGRLAADSARVAPLARSGEGAIRPALRARRVWPGTFSAAIRPPATSARPGGRSKRCRDPRSCRPDA